MGRRTTDGAAANAEMQTVVTYTAEPRGLAMVASLIGEHAAILNGARPVVPANPEWDGWTQPQQSFRGLAALGAARVITPTTSELEQESTITAYDPATAIFAARLARGGR